ncbi:MAG: FAD/NAD(P)-binding protein [Rhodospirillales bacterium]
MAPATDVHPMVPRPFRIERVVRDIGDTFTLHLRAADGGQPFPFAPGQFNMLYQFGVGEVPISISGDPGEPDTLVHTIRSVGTVTRAMAALGKGGIVGVRGPFGSAWPMAAGEGHDIVVIAGGIGLAPLRPAVLHVIANRGRYGRLRILYGARTPRDILFRSQLERWSSRLDTFVDVTVDRASGDWRGNVGVVTRLIAHGGYDPAQTVAMICGPETMIRFSVQALLDRGVDDDRIHVSMERNMKCAVGFCGHCQYGGHFVCRDGPVFGFDRIRDIFAVREV